VESPLPAPSVDPLREQSAPADLVPSAGVWQRLAWYAGSCLLTCVLVCLGLRLDRADLNSPFYYDLDSLLILPMVKATAERGLGGHWRNERMGVGVGEPGQTQFMELYDFPVVDFLHFSAIWLLSKIVAPVVLLFNLYFLLTFPLTTLTAMIVFRHLRLTLPAAAVGGMLYAFLPYHYQRWENHYFLAAYWTVPLSLLPVFALCRGRFPFFRRQPDGSFAPALGSWRSLGYVVLGIVVASAGAYYAFFACALILFAGLYSWAVDRDWRAAASAGGVIAVIVVVGVFHHLPTIVYQWEYGRNPITDRHPEEADSYGMKLAHLVLPIPDHNLSILANLRVRYLVPNRPCEGENAGSLGIVGTAGLIGLVAVLFLPYRRGWPYGPLAAVTLFAILLGTIGGFGSVFNLLITAQIRAYNRIGIFISFFCLVAALWSIDRFLITHPRSITLRVALYPLAFLTWPVIHLLRKAGPAWNGRAERIDTAFDTRILPNPIVWGFLLLIGFLDQTPYAWFKSGIIRTIGNHAARFQADARFFGEIERTMTTGSKVFCLPYAPFPEHNAIVKMPVYEHTRGYIHTNTLRWSYGAMKGREVDAWQLDVATPVMTESFEKLPRAIADFVDRIVCAGFDGLFIDTRGFTITKDGDRAGVILKTLHDRYEDFVKARTRRQVDEKERLTVIAHEDKRQFFVDLRPYRDELKKALPSYYDEISRTERDWVALLWLNGFESPEEPVYQNILRFGPEDATAWFVNPSDRDRKFKIWMTFGADMPGLFRMRLSGLINDEFVLDKGPTDWSGPVPARQGEGRYWEITVPPGRHPIRFQCTPPSTFVPADHRRLCYFILLFKREEIR